MTNIDNQEAVKLEGGNLLLDWYNAQAAVVWAAWCAADDSSDDFNPETHVAVPNDSFSDLAKALEDLDALVPADSQNVGTGALNDDVRAVLRTTPAKLDAPDNQEALAEGVPCGGCGATSNSQRCIGCLHDFQIPESAWVRQYDTRTLPSNEALAGDDRNGVEGLLREAEAALSAVIRLSDMGLEESLQEPEENGNFASYNRAVAVRDKISATLSRTPSSPQADEADVADVADVERVARAIYESNPIVEQEVDPDHRPIGKPGDVSWDAICECYPEQYRTVLDFARAAIDTMTTRPAGVEETNMPSFVHASQVGGYVELTQDVRRSDGALFPKGMKLQLVRLEKAGYPYWWIARDPKTGEECMLFDAHELTFSNARKAPGDRESPKYVPCDGPAGVEEVAQVVAWLRSGDENDLIARRIADAIERGEHRADLTPQQATEEGA